MPDIFQDFPIKAAVDRVFQAISTPRGLDQWWTKTSASGGGDAAEFDLGFGPGYDWRARVSRFVRNSEFELTMTVADPDWTGSRVGFKLDPRDDGTWVQFHHTGWPSANEHFRISNHCWAMYLRVLRRWLEHDETVPYEERLDVQTSAECEVRSAECEVPSAVVFSLAIGENATYFIIRHARFPQDLYRVLAELGGAAVRPWRRVR